MCVSVCMQMYVSICVCISVCISDYHFRNTFPRVKLSFFEMISCLSKRTTQLFIPKMHSSSTLLTYSCIISIHNIHIIPTSLLRQYQLALNFVSACLYVYVDTCMCINMRSRDHPWLLFFRQYLPWFVSLYVCVLFWLWF